jgi:hypothetical protein
MSESSTQRVLFPELSSKPIVAVCDQEHGSSDGGALLLKAADDRLGLTARLSACLDDPRESAKIRHEWIELLRQRVFLLACGYADANDGDALANDPIHKLLIGRDPIEGERLASQPTVSRFENAVSRRDLLRMATALGEAVIERHRRRRGRRTRLITIDFDVTHDPTHGQQEFSFYHGFYRSHCYLPLLGTLQFDDEAHQYLYAAVLRPGRSGAAHGLIGILRRSFEALRRAFPRARLRVRLDGGFATPALLDFLEAERAEYVVGMGTNVKLRRLSRRALARARRLSRDSGEAAQVYGEIGAYQTRRWSHPRRVIYKAEVTRHPGRDPRDNVRFVVTNLRQVPRSVYRVYRERGDMENRIKELKHGLEIDRTSCSRFLPNQLRVLLTAVAYVLMQEIRLQARHTGVAHAQVSTLRTQLLKIGAWVEVSVRRIVVHLPRSFPGQADWLRLASMLGARAG